MLIIKHFQVLGITPLSSKNDFLTACEQATEHAAGDTKKLADISSAKRYFKHAFRDHSTPLHLIVSVDDLKAVLLTFNYDDSLRILSELNNSAASGAEQSASQRSASSFAPSTGSVIDASFLYCVAGLKGIQLYMANRLLSESEKTLKKAQTSFHRWLQNIFNIDKPQSQSKLEAMINDYDDIITLLEPLPPAKRDMALIFLRFLPNFADIHDEKQTTKEEEQQRWANKQKHEKLLSNFSRVITEPSSLIPYFREDLASIEPAIDRAYLLNEAQQDLLDVLFADSQGAAVEEKLLVPYVPHDNNAIKDILHSCEKFLFSLQYSYFLESTLRGMRSINEINKTLMQLNSFRDSINILFSDLIEHIKDYQGITNEQFCSDLLNNWANNHLPNEYRVILSNAHAKSARCPVITTLSTARQKIALGESFDDSTHLAIQNGDSHALSTRGHDLTASADIEQGYTQNLAAADIMIRELDSIIENLIRQKNILDNDTLLWEKVQFLLKIKNEFLNLPINSEDNTSFIRLCTLTRITAAIQTGHMDITQAEEHLTGEIQKTPSCQLAIEHILRAYNLPCNLFLTTSFIQLIVKNFREGYSPLAIIDLQQRTLLRASAFPEEKPKERTFPPALTDVIQAGHNALGMTANRVSQTKLSFFAKEDRFSQALLLENRARDAAATEEEDSDEGFILIDAGTLSARQKSEDFIFHDCELLMDDTLAEKSESLSTTNHSC